MLVARVSTDRCRRVPFHLPRPVPLADAVVEVYTTRPDTLFGATYMVVAPEHPLLTQLACSEQAAAVAAYVDAAAKKSDFERTELSSKQKSGVFTGTTQSGERSLLDAREVAVLWLAGGMPAAGHWWRQCS